MSNHNVDKLHEERTIERSTSVSKEEAVNTKEYSNGNDKRDKGSRMVKNNL